MQEQEEPQKNSQQGALSSTAYTTPAAATTASTWGSWLGYFPTQPTPKGIWGPFNHNSTSSTSGGASTHASSPILPGGALPSSTNGTKNTNETGAQAASNEGSTLTNNPFKFTVPTNTNNASIFNSSSLNSPQLASDNGPIPPTASSTNTPPLGAQVDPSLLLLRKPSPSNSTPSNSLQQSSASVKDSSESARSSLVPYSSTSSTSIVSTEFPKPGTTTAAVPSAPSSHNDGSSTTTGTIATSNNSNAGTQVVPVSNGPAVAAGQPSGGQQSVNSVPNTGAAAANPPPPPPSKPVLKMKRTGQTFSLDSASSNGSFTRHSSFSPKLANPVRKSSDPAPSRLAVGSSSAARAATATPVTKPSAETSANRPAVQPSPRPLKENIPPNPPPAIAATTDGDDLHKPGAEETVDLESDGEIKYENVNGLDKDAFEIDNEEAGEESSDESESDSENETEEADPSGQSHQLFRAPGQESDDDEDEYDDDETEEASSSEDDDESTVADEPTVALPSAKIQHQAAYPPAILEMATPDRPYWVFIEDGKQMRAGPAIFPAGYSKSQEIRGYPWICSVRSCRLVYKTTKGLSNHFKLSHRKHMFNDNLDGTLSLVGSYTKKNETGRAPPVVVSKRALDPKEPPMVNAKLPVAAKYLRLQSAKNSAAPSVPDLANDMDDAAHVEKPQSLPPPSADDMQRSQDNWTYIKPFLKVHDAVPVINWVKHVLPLPRVRDIKWNEARLVEHPYNDSHPRDVTALIVQITGVESPTPCNYCTSGKGPFSGCIMISPNACAEARAGVLSCANCYYHCRQSLCSHCGDAITRRQQRERAFHEPGSYNLKNLTYNPTRGKTVTTTANATARSSSQQALQPSGFKHYSPSEITPIEMATSDRPYKVLKGKDGEMILLHGALIPEKYDLDPTIPGHPWICPVRTCRIVFKKIVNLGSHFVNKHRACLFNDNLDGTLSQIGVYNVPLPGNVGCPALIISRKPLDKSAAALQQAALSSFSMAKEAQEEKTVRHKQALKHSKDMAKTRKTDDSVAKKMWDYVVPFFPRPLASLKAGSPAITLLSMPRKRDLQWRRPGKVLIGDEASQVAGLLIHLVGNLRDEAVGKGRRPCTQCARGEGPFEGCQVLPSDAPFELHSAFRSCANCIFTRHWACSLKSGWERRGAHEPKTSSAAPLPPVLEWAKAAADGTSAGAGAKRPRPVDSDDEDGEPVAQRRRSERTHQQSVQPEPEQLARKMVTLSGPNTRDKSSSASAGVTTRNETSLRRNASNGAPRSAASKSSALINAGQVQSEDLLEMEEWEIAPGRIRQTGAERVDNIAFSKAYLETNQTVRVSRDVSFEVKTIKSGHSYEMDADAHRTRYCSVASGKLRVCIKGQPDFTIGTHGLFKVAPGLKTRVQNRLYVDSVLHISSYSED